MTILCIFLAVIFIAENYMFMRILRQRNGLIKQGFRQTEKYRIFFELTSEWFRSDMAGKKISDWMLGNKYQTVAIYGMGALGELTYINLCKSKKICVKYVLDRRVDVTMKGLNIYRLKDKLEHVDLIIVTAVMSYEEIKNEIKENLDFPCRIISLQQLLEEIHIESE